MLVYLKWFGDVYLNFNTFYSIVPLVEMLKVHFPKVVDMHNYTPSNSFAQKVDNWRTLQRKVLSRKLKISFPQSVLDAVSKAEAGVVEEVLWQIKMAIDKLDWTVKNQESEVYLVEGFGNEIAGKSISYVYQSYLAI